MPRHCGHAPCGLLNEKSCGEGTGALTWQRGHTDSVECTTSGLPGALTDATHGMTLAAVSLPYYRLIKPYGLKKFVRFATNVWGVAAAGKSETQVADEGLAALEAWMREIGVAMNITELGASEAMIPDLVKATFRLNGGYKQLTESKE